MVPAQQLASYILKFTQPGVDFYNDAGCGEFLQHVTNIVKEEFKRGYEDIKGHFVREFPNKND